LTDTTEYISNWIRFYPIYLSNVQKNAVYTLVNGFITHQKQQISKKEVLRSMTLPKCQCTAEHITFFVRHNPFTGDFSRRVRDKLK